MLIQSLEDSTYSLLTWLFGLEYVQQTEEFFINICELIGVAALKYL